MAGAGPLPPSSAGAEIESIRSMVSVYFPVYETRITPQSLVLLVHADPGTLEERFDRLRQEMWPKFYVPQIRRELDRYVVEVIRRPNRSASTAVTNIILLALTIVTTVTAGAFLWLAYVGGSHLVPADFLWGGLTFALPLMTILGLHELAHYIMARHHHVEASLPYFIPVPPPFLLFGTFGAFISLREPIPSKKALLDIGASGPLAGFAVSIPVTLLGMYLSAHAPVLSVANCGPTVFGVGYGNLLFGLSLFWLGLGQFIPVAFVNLHPVALAGWVGLLVTAINLLPAGQLDGGHVFRALLGEKARWVSWAAVIALFGLGILYTGWFIFAILIFFLGVRHPPPLNDITPLDRKRWAIGIFAAAILVTGFVIVPISAPTGAFNLSDRSSSPVAVPSGFAMADNLTMRVNNADLIPHGYVVTGSIGSVTTTTGVNKSVLHGASLTAFEKNSTWRLSLPNGNQTTITGVGSFSLPSDQYWSISPGGWSMVTITYLNSQADEVAIAITISELCESTGPGPVTADFTAV